MSESSYNNLKCYLVPVSSSITPIFLPNEVEVKLGRTGHDEITDSYCSKEQVVFMADYNNEIVLVKSLGQIPSHFDGEVMTNNDTYRFGPNNVLEIIPGRAAFKVEFQKQSCNKAKVPKLLTPIIKNPKGFSWKVCGSGELLMCISPGFDETKAKVASFDLDGTLIKTKSGRVFSKDFEDWVLWDDSIKYALKRLVKNNYKIVIFTNQAGLGTVAGFKNKVDGFKKKVENIIEALNVPIQVFVAISNGLYRKPSPGMWFFMKMRRELPIDLDHSFFVGDAAGRPGNWKPGKKADFAMSDRMFAINIGVKFYTPEEYFLKEPMAPYTEIKFHPWQYARNSKMPNLKLSSSKQEVIIMVGSPGSGKSHFVKHYVESLGYHVISRDKLGTWQKCVAVLKDVLKSRKSAVVDNTNPDCVSRKRFLEVCAQYNVQVRCFFMDITLERCLHNNKFREIIDSEHVLIASSIINAFQAKFERPTTEEGFASVVKIPFIYRIDNDEQEFFYNCYLVAK